MISTSSTIQTTTRNQTPSNKTQVASATKGAVAETFAAEENIGFRVFLALYSAGNISSIAIGKATAVLSLSNILFSFMPLMDLSTIRFEKICSTFWAQLPALLP